MGQILSGDLADGKLWDLCEKGFADLPAIRSHHAIHMYARYRDDICIVYSKPNHERALRFVQKIDKACSASLSNHD